MCSVAAPKVDLLRATATDLQQLMHDGKLTSVDLVKQILDQIEGHNEAGVGIRAMLAVAPRELLIDRANALDEERNGGSTRGPLHGIPIIVKDCFNTDASTGLNTTVGSFAFANAKAKNGRLLERGLIIIGKTNLNEFCNWKGIDQWNGWSAVGGQTNSAYFEGGLQRNDGKMGHSNPCGSSTGSAVGVSAGFSPIGLGTETDGSLVQPGARAALYTLKPTPGTTDLDGVWMVSADFDAVGAMTKSTADLALITELVLNQKAREALPDGGFQGFLHTDFDGVKVGFLDPAIWRWPPHIQKQEEGTLEQIHSAYHNAIDTIQKNGGKTVYPVTIPLVEDLQYEGELASNKAMFHSFQHNVEQYMKSLEQSDVRTLKELVAFINQHAQNELPPEHPEQGKLKRALENATSEAIYEACMEHCATVVKGGLDRALAEYDVDLIAMPMDCPIPSVASCARYPIASMPLGMLDYNGRPFGLAIIGRAGEEGLMFKFMSAFESVFPSRSVPRRLDEWQRSRASL